MNLRGYFDRVVLVNLPRRPDRLRQVKKALRECAWPFQQPEVFAAVDGLVSPPPPHWKHQAGAWGCTQSLLAVLEQALADGVKSLLVLEDDVCFAPDFREGVERFLRTVPGDWDGLMLGGQHIIEKNGWPKMARRGIYRCFDCERTHCFAVRGKYMARLCERWRGGGRFRGNAHCDQIMGRDPQLQRAHRVYAPEFFLVGQERSASDVSGKFYPRRFWNPPGPHLRLINLHAPRAVMESLRQYGCYTGYDHDPASGMDRKLEKIFQYLKKHPREGRLRLRKWIITLQWEVCGDPNFVGTVWHPEATPSLINEVSLWPVCEVTADHAQAALRQLPLKLSLL